MRASSAGYLLTAASAAVSAVLSFFVLAAVEKTVGEQRDPAKHKMMSAAGKVALGAVSFLIDTVRVNMVVHRNRTQGRSFWMVRNRLVEERGWAAAFTSS